MPAPSSALFGHLYVIQFADGLVKVGRAAKVAPRLASHGAEGARHSNPAVAQWSSVFLADLVDAEYELIDWCVAQPGSRLVSGNEWFHDVDYDAAVRQAEKAALKRVISPTTGCRPSRVESCGEAVTLDPGRLVRLPPPAPPSKPVLVPIALRAPTGGYGRRSQISDDAEPSWNPT